MPARSQSAVATMLDEDWRVPGSITGKDVREGDLRFPEPAQRPQFQFVRLA